MRGVRGAVAARLIAHVGGERLTLASPMEQELTTPTLGVKILLGNQQYGAFVDESGLAALGITIAKDVSIAFDMQRLIEGTAPDPVEVPS